MGTLVLVRSRWKVGDGKRYMTPKFCRKVSKGGQSIQTGQPFEMVFPLHAADGRFRPFLATLRPFPQT